MKQFRSWRYLHPLLSVIILSLASASLASAQAINIFTFPNKGGKAFPSGLITDSSGNLFGTTVPGGSCSTPKICGTVFELSPQSGGGWTETTLYSNPGVGILGSPLAMDAGGNLYGVVATGGNTAPKYCGDSGCGAVFELSPDGNGWTYTELFAFHGNDGADPVGALVFDAAGNLYGETYQGGTSGWGTIYKLTPVSGGWTHKVLHFFTNAADGKFPQTGLTIDTTGNLYGVASGGVDSGGVVFKLTLGTNGAYGFKYIHAFTGGKMGLFPTGPLLLNDAGDIFGETLDGGSPLEICGRSSTGGCGIVYELQKTSTGYLEHVIFPFMIQFTGASPQGGLIRDNSGNLYGTTSYAVTGELKTWGNVFELATNGSTWGASSLVHGTKDLGTFTGGLVRDSLGNLYGVDNNQSIWELPAP